MAELLVYLFNDNIRQGASARRTVATAYIFMDTVILIMYIVSNKRVHTSTAYAARLTSAVCSPSCQM